MDPRELVASFVAVVQQQPRASEAELSDMLQSKGASKAEAERAVAFVPVAFGRLAIGMDHPGVKDSFEVRDPETGRSLRGSLSQEPIYTAAVAYGREVQSPDVMARSPELGVLFDLGEDPSNCRHVVFTELLFLRIPIR